MVERLALQLGDVQKALAKRTPCAASRSIFGITALGSPYDGRQHPRSSAIISSTFFRVVCAETAVCSATAPAVPFAKKFSSSHYVFDASSVDSPVTPGAPNVAHGSIHFFVVAQSGPPDILRRGQKLVADIFEPLIEGAVQ